MKLTRIARDIVVCVVLGVIACYAINHGETDLAGVALGARAIYYLVFWRSNLVGKTLSSSLARAMRLINWRFLHKS
jgi:hypothetical protein